MKKILLLTGSLALLLMSCGEKETENTKVNMHMWGGSQEINKFMDEIIAPELKKQNNIDLNRIPVTDIKDTVNKLIVEKKAGKKNGTADILWVNGENFKQLKEAQVLSENITENLSNIGMVNKSTLVKDFGEPINGMEVPWGEAQFNFIYNTKNGEIPFDDYQSLFIYIKNNPEKFTYPAVTNFTGSAFVRNIAVDIIGSENIENMTNHQLKDELKIVWSYLNEIEPFLWRKGETYPESEGKLDTLYSNGEIDVTMGYTINKVTSKIEAGQYPSTSKSFLLKNGTLFNNHYLAIPNNSQNKTKALEVINYLISPEAQLAKQEPKNWGDLTILDIDKLSFEMQQKFRALVESDKIPTMVELKESRVRELSPDKLTIINEGWIENVGKK